MNKTKVGIDLNLLRIVVAMYEVKSLKAVGRKLDRSESAISKALLRASEELGQTLFVRTAEGLEPTHYTTSIYPNLKDGLIKVHNALDTESFTAMSYNLPIHIAMLAQPMNKYGALILAKLRENFPNAQVEMSIWDHVTPKKILDDHIDIGVYAITESLPSSLYQKAIVDDVLSVFVAKSHNDITWNTIKHWPFIFTRTAGWNDNHFKIQRRFEQLGEVVKVPFIVDDINTCTQLVQQGQFALPYSRHCKLDNMQEVDTPDSITMNIKIASIVKQTNRNAPLQRLLNKIVSTVIADK
ncbi:LysR family transcriptional regulator [uncultured Vibrio sp.]|uniref:LysR family transcriptional regulator n=1 Tax=uncultured Vibrio sp. TaxID=114054 RepID=UPI0025EFFB09|nr:LysR family transcriptional regulator [uncultured Vibrio sp.]